MWSLKNQEELSNLQIIKKKYLKCLPMTWLTDCLFGLRVRLKKIKINDSYKTIDKSMVF